MDINPTISNFTGLQNPEQMIQEMQGKIVTNLTWIEKVFGLAEVIKLEDTTFPAVYLPGNNDPLNVFPNDNWTSHAFFLRGKNAVTYVKNETTSPVMHGRNEAELSIIFVVDLKRISNSGTDFHVASSNARKEILNCIQTKFIGIGTGGFVVDEIIEDPELVFEEFTIASVPVNLYTFPVKCFRFKGTLTWWDMCKTVSWT